LAERASPLLPGSPGTRLAGAAALTIGALLAGCASGPRSDGAPASPPSNLSQLPDAQPQVEPIRSSGGTAKPYTVLGRRYVPMTDDRPFQERGLASWYGTGFHARQTASGESYDMYSMTAAHKTLPLPSYVRVRNPANGREAIVRVNDRGPFVDGRIIDLSYAAAARLGLLAGVAPVEIERLTNEDIRTGAWRRDDAVQLASADASPGYAPSTAASRAVVVPAAMAVPVAATGSDLSAANGPTAPVPAPAAASTAPEPPAAPSLTPSPSPSPASPLAPAITPPPAPARHLDVSPLPPMTPMTPPATPSVGDAAPGAAAAPAADNATPPGTAESYWVQLGAFRARDGAVAMQERIERDTARPVGQLQVYEDGGLFRLQSGPHTSRADAVQAQARWRLQLGGSPIIVQRR